MTWADRLRLDMLGLRMPRTGGASDSLTPSRTMPLRGATQIDLPTILAIYNDVIVNSNAIYTETLVTLENHTTWLAPHTTQGCPVLVADDNGQVAGVAPFGDSRPYPGFRTTAERSTHVRRDWRGKGLGSRLVEAPCERTATLSKHLMVGAIDGASAGSIRLHERPGFEEVGRIPGTAIKHGQWLDLTFM